jgi:T4 RnlA family RNA ligase
MDINGNGEKKMLEIVKFIHEHKDWEALLSGAPYNLKISWDDGFVLFKYNQINSDFNEKICREARGLILDSTQNFKVVRFAFERFFNLGESHAAQIEWPTAWASEKIDGSIMSAWYARGKWHLSTNGCIDAFKAEINNPASPYKTYGELFEAVCPLSNFKNYNKIKCWTFELVSPVTRIVLDYPEPALYLLSIRDMRTLLELYPEAVEMIGDACGFETPKHYYFNSKRDYCEFVKNMGDNNEGIVVCDADFDRVKIKTEKYVELHRMANNGVLTVERALAMILENEQDEFLAYFGQYRDFFHKVSLQYKAAIGMTLAVKEMVENWKKEHCAASRKEFSDWVKKNLNEHTNWAYLAYDDKLSIEGKTAKELVKFLGLK